MFTIGDTMIAMLLASPAAAILSSCILIEACYRDVAMGYMKCIVGWGYYINVLLFSMCPFFLSPFFLSKPDIKLMLFAHQMIIVKHYYTWMDDTE